MKSMFTQSSYRKFVLTTLAGALLASSSGAALAAAPTNAPNSPATLAQIRDSAMSDDWAYDRLADLTDLIGPRLLVRPAPKRPCSKWPPPCASWARQ